MCIIGLDRINLVLDVDGLVIDTSKLEESKEFREGNGVFIRDTAYDNAHRGIAHLKIGIDTDSSGQGAVTVITNDNPNKQAYESLQVLANVVCPRFFYQTNERNIYEADKLKQLDTLIPSKLEEKGIYVQSAAISKLEVNTNTDDIMIFPTMKLVAESQAKDGEKVFIVQTKNGIESIKVNKTSKEIKVYNKSKHIKDMGGKPEYENLIRFEISTSSKAQLETLLGKERRISGIFENWNKIQRWYRRMFKKEIIDSIIRFSSDTEQKIVNLLCGEVKPPDIVSAMYQNDIYLDYDIVRAAIKRYYAIQGKKRYYDTFKRIETRAKMSPSYQEKIGNIGRLYSFYASIL